MLILERFTLPANAYWTEELREALESLSDPVWLFDVDYMRMLWSNPQGLYFWKAEDLEALQNREFETNMSSTSQERLHAYLPRFRNGFTVQDKWTFFPLGVPATVQTVVAGVYLENDRLGILFRARNQDLQSEQLRGIETLRHTTIMITLCSKRGQLLMENPAALNVYGFSKERTPSNVFEKRFVQRNEAKRAGALLSENLPYMGEIQVRTQRGIRWHALDARPIIDPITGSPAILLNEQDISLRKQSQLELEEAHEKLEQRVLERTLALRKERNFVQGVLDTVSSLVVVANTDGQIVRVNSAVEQLLRQEEKALQEQSLYQVLGFPDPNELATWLNAPNDDPTDDQRESSLMLPNGRPRQVFWTTRVLHDSTTGQAMYLICNGVDITERRELQMRLQISDRMASLGTLAAGVAHEINNPLSYVIGNIELLLEELLEHKSLPQESREELSKLANESLLGSRRLAKIVEELQLLTHGNEGDLEYVNVRTVIDSALRIAMNHIRHRAQVKLDADANLMVRANESKLIQVLLNLLINSAQAIEEGDVAQNTIRIHTKNGSDAMIRIFIEDTGCGIPEEHQRRIFDPFFTTKPVGMGTGLGLSICHRLISEFDGTISIASQAGQGTTAIVSLPAITPSSASLPAHEPAPPRLPLLHKAKILVVDDEQPLARLLERALKEFDIQTAESGRIALSLIESHQSFDLILCDLMMPDLTGMDLYDALRTKFPGLEERMVFMTGGAFTERARTFVSETQNIFVSKPFQVEHLRTVLTQQLAAF